MHSKDSFVEAHDRIKPYILNSPMIYSKWLSDIIQGKVYLKLECLQEGRSFKIRGATNALLVKQGYSSVIAASGGNHGLALSISAQKLGKKCKIVVPISTSKYRIELIEKAGAEVIVHGEAFDEADEFARLLAQDEGGVYIHPFADVDVFHGQGTVALEIFGQIKKPEVIIASIGGGGLLGGISACIQSIKKLSDLELFGVETEGTNSMFQSIKAGKIVKLEKITSIAGTLGAKETHQLNFEAIRYAVKEVILVSDKEAVQAMKDFLGKEKILIEPAASCVIAALRKHRQYFINKTVVLVICGSNVTLEEFERWNERFLS